jgi:hypothetical protein
LSIGIKAIGHFVKSNAISRIDKPVRRRSPESQTVLFFVIKVGAKAFIDNPVYSDRWGKMGSQLAQMCHILIVRGGFAGKP